MNMVLSYIHILGCIGWTVFWFVEFVPMIFRPYNGFDAIAILASAALLLTTTTGIYLFTIGRNNPFTTFRNSSIAGFIKLKIENAILAKQIEQAKLRHQLETTENTKKT